MSLMRAFTTRRTRPEELNNTMLGRAASQRNGKPVIRTQISSPIALISTSNMLSYTAPNIQGASPVLFRNASSGSSMGSTSGEESDASTAANSIHSADTANTEMDSSPISAEPNHLSCYFKPAVETSANSSPAHSPHSSQTSFDAPQIPSRAPSHSKKAHVTLSRQRSMRLQSPPLSAHSSVEIFSSKTHAFVEAPRENPFGKELAQLDEVAEEFGKTVRDVEADADNARMQSHDLACFSAPDYLTEIRSLLNELYGEEEEAVAWI